MSEFKNLIISIIIFILWSFGCFGTGYLLSNKRATERINNANRELAEQQLKYDELIRVTDDRIRAIKDELRGKVKDNGQTITELSKLIEQIKRQRIDI